MPASKGKTTHEFEGRKALERVKAVLQSYDIDGDVDRIYVEIEETYPEEEEESDEDSGKKTRGSDNDARDFKEIRPDTNHHKVLYTLSERNNDELPASAAEISDSLDEVPRTSINASLSDLHKRKLVDRERITDVQNPYHVYEVSWHGRGELERLGKPN